jgi:hypothetical protein
MPQGCPKFFTTLGRLKAALYKAYIYFAPKAPRNIYIHTPLDVFCWLARQNEGESLPLTGVFFSQVRGIKRMIIYLG